MEVRGYLAPSVKAVGQFPVIYVGVFAVLNPFGVASYDAAEGQPLIYGECGHVCKLVVIVMIDNIPVAIECAQAIESVNRFY